MSHSQDIPARPKQINCLPRWAAADHETDLSSDCWERAVCCNEIDVRLNCIIALSPSATTTLGLGFFTCCRYYLQCYVGWRLSSVDGHISSINQMSFKMYYLVTILFFLLKSKVANDNTDGISKERTHKSSPVRSYNNSCVLLKEKTIQSGDLWGL